MKNDLDFYLLIEVRGGVVNDDIVRVNAGKLGVHLILLCSVALARQVELLALPLLWRHNAHDQVKICVQALLRLCQIGQERFCILQVEIGR